MFVLLHFGDYAFRRARLKFITTLWHIGVPQFHEQMLSSFNACINFSRCRFDIKSNGGLTALPYVVMYCIAVAAGQLADFIRLKGYVGTATLRKLYQTLGI